MPPSTRIGSSEKQAVGEDQALARREAVTSTLRFVDAFPKHEQAAAVLGAAVDDLYDMKEFALAIATGQRLIDGYPEADVSIRRSAWAVIAHSSFDTGDYAEGRAGLRARARDDPAGDASRQAVVDNLAAAIYKQGEQANLAQDHRAAADHFLRIAQAAPTSEDPPARRVRRRRGADPVSRTGRGPPRCWMPSGRPIRTTS